MSTITTRSGKGSPLTNNEVDSNFTNLNTDKAELSGATFTGEIVANAGIALGDNDKATFGAGDDLQIYHDGSNSIIYEGGTGDLQLRGNGGSTTIMNGGGTETLANFGNNGAVTLYHDNAIKLATTSTGIDVTGTATMDGLTVEAASNALIRISDSTNANQRLDLEHNGGVASIVSGNNGAYGTIKLQGYNGTDTVDRFKISANGDVDLGYEATGTTPKMVWDASAEILTTTGMTVETATGTATPTPTQITIATSSAGGDWSETDPWGRLAFYSADTSAGGAKEEAALDVVAAQAAGGVSDFFVKTYNSGLKNRIKVGYEGDVSFYEDTGTTPKMVWSAANETLTVDGVSQLGTVSIYDNGTNATVVADSGHDLELRGRSGQNVNVYANGALNTTFSSTGIDVTGTATMDGLTVNTTNGVSVFESTGISSVGLQFKTNTSNRFLIQTPSGSADLAFLAGGTTKALNLASNGDVSFYEDTGTTPKFFWDASAEFLGIGTDTQTVNGESLRLVNGIFLNGGGTKEIPSLGLGDSNSGLFGSTFVAVTTNGQERFRVNTNGTVGIGTDSPDTLLEIVGADPILTIRDTETAGASTNATLRLAESGASDTLNDYWDINYTGLGALAFKTKYGTSLTEAMRIDASGNLLVGKTAAVVATVGHALLPDGQHRVTADGAITAIHNRLTSDGDIIQFRKDSVTVGSIGSVSSDIMIGTGNTGLRFVDAVDAIAPCTTAGIQTDAQTDIGRSSFRFKDAYLSGGVYLGGTGAANKLDDYEEGTWTPVIADAITGGNTATGSTIAGFYTKVGNIVTITAVLININTSGMTSGSDLVIRDLPFTSFSGNAGRAEGSLRADQVTFSGQIAPNIEINDSYIKLAQTVSAISDSFLNVSAISSGNSDIFLSMTYHS